MIGVKKMPASAHPYFHGDEGEDGEKLFRAADFFLFRILGSSDALARLSQSALARPPARADR